MRAAIVITIVALSLPVALFRPFYGALLWSWAAYFRPHDLAWGVQDYRLSFLIAIATSIGFFFALLMGRERITNLFCREVLLILMMLAILAIVCDCALYNQEDAWEKFHDYWKIFLMTLLTASLITSGARLRMMAWAVALSIGALGFKGGFLGALRGAKLQGPGGFILDNNDFALALNMALPMLYYLAITEKEKLHKWILGLTAFFTAVAVILTHSRGGFLGLVAVAFFLALKSRRKTLAISSLVFLIFLGVTLIPFISPEYFDRIKTIEDFSEDGSVRGRFNAWETCWRIGMERPFTGVGPRNLDNKKTFDRYAPNPLNRHVAHNIYFQTLSDGGFTLLIPFVFLLLFTYLTLRRLRKRTPKLPENLWIINYCHMFEVSLMAFAVSGFFLSRNDFDLYYHIVGIVVAMKAVFPRVVVREAGPAAAAETTAESTAGTSGGLQP